MGEDYERLNLLAGSPDGKARHDECPIKLEPRVQRSSQEEGLMNSHSDDLWRSNLVGERSSPQNMFCDSRPVS